MNLKDLKPAKGAVRDRKRLGRGPGSGVGKTSGRGHKGGGARTGYGVKPSFEGGQMPLTRRLPKRGFRNPTRAEVQIVALGRLEGFAEGAVIDAEVLLRAGLIRKGRPVKILADGELTKRLTVRVDRISAKAREKVVGAGGTVEVVVGA